MASKITATILTRLKDTLATAKLGLRDVSGPDPSRRLGGLRNVVVFGRAVTNVLQNLRSTEGRFDAWYEPWRTEMEGDPLMKYLYRVRSEILKEGALATSAGVHIKHFEFPKDMQRLGPPPQGAKSFFMGDRAGGSGWQVETEDGATETFYIDIPGDLARFQVTLPDAPTEHLGRPLADRRIETIASKYVEYLSALVDAAQHEFGAQGA